MREKWKQDANLREIKVMRRYHIQDREDYHKYVLLLPSLSPHLRNLTYAFSIIAPYHALAAIPPDTTNSAAPSVLSPTVCRSYRPRTHFARRWRAKCCPSCTTWASSIHPQSSAT